MGKKFYLLFILILCCIYIFPPQVDGKNKYTVKIVQPDQVRPPVISSVTVSPENKNLIAWEQTPNENIEYFNIYRDAANPDDAWINVGKITYPGNYSFTDVSSFPSVRSYQYRISAIDKCGNEVFSLRTHKTIRLVVTQISDVEYLLNWNWYEGYDVAGYKINRGIDFANLASIDTISYTETSYTDNKNWNNDEFYQVEAIEKQDTTLTLKRGILGRCKTRSNIASKRAFLTFTDTVDASRIYVYPNPLTINAVVIFPYDASQTWQLSIFDITGHIVYSRAVVSGEIEIERKNLKEGMYILQVAGKKIYRKKLIVGRV